MHSGPAEETVYLQQKEAFLRDKVAAVSNRTGHVDNGERLVVLEHGRRFIRVRDARNETGWLEERAVVNQKTFDQFEELKQQNASAAPVMSATIRDDVAEHVAPGRDTEHFYMLKEGDKVQLLKRASTPKPLPPQAAPAKTSVTTTAAAKPKPEKKKLHGPAPIPGAPDVPYEDWWLVRDAAGHVGWILGRRFDPDIPDSIAGYAETMRWVAAYTLTTVNDPDADVPNHEVPEYLALLEPYRDGLPYDYNMVRVFTWNTKKHRYETAYRQRDLWGYLPVSITKQTFTEGVQPVFTLRVSSTQDVTIDPATAMPKPGLLDTLQYRLNGPVVQKVLPQNAQPAAKPAQAVARHRGGPRARRRRR